MVPTIEDLQAARKILVRIVQAREDGSKFVPFVLALEKYLAKSQGIEDDLNRILAEIA